MTASAWEKTGHGAWSTVRSVQVPDPAFLLPTFVAEQLLGAQRLFAFALPPSHSNASSYAGAAYASTGEHDSVPVQRRAAWLATEQVLGQFARIGVSCGCQRANRTVLGSSILKLTPLVFIF